MRIAMVGTGFVVDFYMMTLGNHPELELVGIMDRDPDRAQKIGARYGVPKYASLDEVLNDDRVQLIVNLTNPASHYEVSRAALQAGKHVYSEKPLALDLEQAKELVVLARTKGLELAGAPCNSLSASAQTLWRAVRTGVIGRVRLVYAEMDDGMIPRQAHHTWNNWSGFAWPAKDEFEVGCTLEHAGYYLTWLTALFGPATKIEAANRCLLQDKGIELSSNAPDFSVALIEFEQGVVARLTCSIVAPSNHGITVVGEEGVLSVEDCWFYASPVYLQRVNPKSGALEKRRGYPMLRGEEWLARYHAAVSEMDFARGVAELAGAIREGRPCRLGAEFSLHVTEIALAIQRAPGGVSTYLTSTRFDPVAPMPWAK